MAEENEAPEEELDEAPEQGKGKGKTLIMLGVGLLVLAGGGYGGYALLLQPEPEPEASAETAADDRPEQLYYPILPPITTNFSDGSGRRRFLQVSLEVMAHEQKVIDAVKDHNAVLRNSLLLTFSEIDYERAITREGKEALREQALEDVRTVLAEITGDPGVKNVFFTGFVLQ
ncbi:MAG: flagellar basal body-associated FliL family protein [Pseudomonadota bacterium]